MTGIAHAPDRRSPPAATNRPALTEREQDILLMAALGTSNKHIARRIKVSVRTVENHRTDLRRKLGIGTVGRLEAMLAVVLRHNSKRVAELLDVDEQTVEHQRSALRLSLS
ncbi:MAG: response regulator transcription factor [Rhodocyclales bacterium]|nr:response regulator transcription factor [Rhodocyclales bacterium]